MVDMIGNTTLVLVRHGETEWNRLKRIQGQIDIPLSALGRRQAALLAGRVLRERQDGSRKIDAVISSDLSRAMQTAEPLAAAAGIEVIADIRLRERHYGVFQANDAATIKTRWPAAHAQWMSHDPDFGPDEGESLRTLSARVVGALGAIARDHAGRTVVCVAHGGVLDCAYRFAESRSLAAPRSYRLLNASVNVIDWHFAADPAADSAKVISWGDVSHLEDVVETRDDD